MASIVNSPNPTSDPNYLGLSQGTDRAKVNTANGEFLGDLADIGGKAVKAAYGVATDLIGEQTKAGIEQIRTEAGIYDAADMAATGEAPTRVKGDASNNLFGEPGAGMRAGRGNPAGVSRYGQRVAGLQAKYDSGQLSESYYNSRLLSLTKEIKNQYPGFKEEIDAVVKNVTGIDPANALVRSLRADMDAAERAKAAGASKDETYLNGHAQYVTPATREKWARGDRSPEFVAQFKWEAASAQSRQQIVEQANRELELATKSGKYDQDKTVKVAQLTATEYINKQFLDMSSSSGGAAGILQSIRTRGDKPFTTDEQNKVRADFGQLKSQTAMGIENILAQPQYAQLPAEEKKKIREDALTRIGIVEDAILNQKYGVLTRDANMVESIQNADMRRLLESNEFIRKAAAVSKAAGAAASDVIKGTLMTEEGMHKYSRSILDLNNMELVLGEGSLNDQVKRHKAAAKDVPELKDPGAFKAHIDHAVQGLTKAADISVAENYAKVMFGKGNVGFLENYSPRAQMRVFRSLTSPAVDQKMVEIGRTNPEVYRNYRDWVVSYGFQSQFKRVIDQVNAENKDPGSDVNITFNESTLQYEASAIDALNPDGTLKTNTSLASVQPAINELNEGLRIIAPILKREGGDVSQELGKVLAANGWKQGAEKDPTFIQSLGNAVKRFLVGDGAPEDLEASPLEYRMDKAPTGKGTRSDASSTDTDLVDLDLGTLQDISSKSGGLKKVILQAEAGGDYNAVYGTSRKIPVTRMTVDEVLALQGRMRSAGSPSTAVGGFQFLNSTLKGLKEQMGLTGDELFDEKLQNRLADALLQRRGYGEYLTGKIGHKELVNRLSKEWAGLPNTEGKSHYAGDGLNKATVKLRSVLDALKASEG